MKNNEIFVNGKYYVVEKNPKINGKNKFKITKPYTFGLADIVTKKEKIIVEQEFVRDKSNIFKSDKLNKIAEKNSQLTKVDVLVDILEKIEEFIPDKFRFNFYRNLEFLNIEIAYDLDKSKKYSKDSAVAGAYDPTKNILFINAKALNKYNNKSKSYTVDNYLKRIITHELIHMASTTFDKNGRILFTGVLDINDYGEILNVALNEGITEMFASMIYPDEEVDNISGYKVFKKIAEQITYLVGEDIIYDSYYYNRETSYIETSFANIICDYNKAMDVTKTLAFCTPGIIDKNEFKKLVKVQTILLDYYNKKLDKYIKNNNYEAIAKLRDSISYSFIAEYLNNDLLEKEEFNLIIAKFSELKNKIFDIKPFQRKRKAE